MVSLPLVFPLEPLFPRPRVQTDLKTARGPLVGRHWSEKQVNFVNCVPCSSCGGKHVLKGGEGGEGGLIESTDAMRLVIAWRP